MRSFSSLGCTSFLPDSPPSHKTARGFRHVEWPEQTSGYGHATDALESLAFDFGNTADIICMRMNFGLRRRSFWKALRVPIRKTNQPGPRPRLARRRRLENSRRRHRFLSGAWVKTAAARCARHQWTGRPARHFGRSMAHIVIGARTTWTDVLRADLPPAFDALKQAAREVGSIQIQNCGTVAGNLCNASPAADGVPPLLTLDAEVELRSKRGTRLVSLGDFVLGNRQTALARDELVSAIRIPKAATAGTSAFLKLGARKYLVISIVMVAARLVADAEGKVLSAAVAVGSCSAVAQRLKSLEHALVGLPFGPALGRSGHDGRARRAFTHRRRARQRGLPPRRRLAKSSRGHCSRREAGGTGWTIGRVVSARRRTAA